MNPYLYLNSLKKFGKEGGYKPGLKRIDRLLYYLDRPEENLKFIHVAGTNGKGSTASFIEKIYREAGYKTGIYISPHLYHFNERISVNGRTISSVELAELVAEVKTASDRVAAESEYGEPSFFEIVTALAFLFFDRHRTDIVILEVGLGGRFDATNIIKDSLASVITSIDLEHTELLGDTRSKIAYEKAGIIKNNGLVFSSVSDRDARNVIKKRAEELNAEFINIDDIYTKIDNESSFFENQLILEENSSRYRFELGLNGKYQARNAALAYTVVKRLKEILPVDQLSVEKGLSSTYWPGRLEIICKNPPVLIDGAHNPAGMKSFIDFLEEHQYIFDGIDFVFSVLSDKDIDLMLGQIRRIKNNLHIHLAENRSERTMKIDKMIDRCEFYNLEYTAYKSLSSAVEKVTAYSEEKERLVTASGSFNTVVEAGITARRNCREKIKNIRR
ncbi:MAG: bifunctional folylpolyglutamate synthase/dihydrofolate synthase [Bacillota bacterium]